MDKQANLRQLQLVEKSIMEDVIKVCESNHLTYFLSSGTLLGAVRHKGFIPWDDDIDLCMPAKDYKTFLRIAQQELGDNYFVQNHMTEPNYSFSYTRIRKNNTTLLDPHHKHYKVHQGIWIDIFPLVYVNPGFDLFVIQKVITVCNLLQNQTRIDAHEEEFRQLLGPLLLGIVKAIHKLPVKSLQNVHTAFMTVIMNRSSNRYKLIGELWGNITHVYSKEIFEGSAVNVEFEGLNLRAPHQHLRYLEIQYGDYMTPPPEDKRGGHGNLIVDFEESFEKYV